METKLKKIRNELKSKKGKSHWSEGLLQAMKDPELIVFEDKSTVALYDLYPKASFHYLVCPKKNLPSIKSVEVKHLDLLKHMHEVAEKLCNKHENVNFLIGYHSIPSMIRLHLHVISTDFDSPCMKTKKHWNSFTTEFFLPSDMVIRELENSGKLSFKTTSEYKNFLDKKLKCHKCDYEPKHMPDLKQHTKIHFSSD
ncbi:aprataxin, putative [Pediculus humanus corporis]|uniref:Aprataxin, putative n=1 Tax=Pediculus humanus subsp. corporis TaxID=121224 RepID=E0VMW3_PEDHC|nr:aprataxin, putative [Pediculus humanus corporis]EEB14719.1 aprataxin, putative [Pediculus humanus corporis]